MCENNGRYDCKTARLLQKNKAMHVNPNNKWYMKFFFFFFKNLKTENFSILISRILIEPSRFKPKFLSQFRSVERQIQLIENMEKIDF